MLNWAGGLDIKKTKFSLSAMLKNVLKGYFSSEVIALEPTFLFPILTSDEGDNTF